MGMLNNAEYCLKMKLFYIKLTFSLQRQGWHYQLSLIVLYRPCKGHEYFIKVVTARDITWCSHKFENFVSHARDFMQEICVYKEKIKQSIKI